MIAMPTDAEPVTVVEGDCLEVLRGLPDGCVQTCVTSPPYFGLRDYGHAGQIGLEPTPAEYVAKLVAVFAEVWRVLKDDGTLWLNLGDSYARGERVKNPKDHKRDHKRLQYDLCNGDAYGKTAAILPNKQLVGIPWRVAFALQDAGWYLRQDIIWHKPNPMPESVRDRCTKAHEYIFLLSKRSRYYFDADAIAEEASGTDERPQQRRAKELAAKHGLTPQHIAAIRSCGVGDAGKAQTTQDGCGKNAPDVQRLADEAKAALGGYYREFLMAPNKNKRSVWTVTPQPFAEAHFATFPPELIRPCVRAGCPEGGLVLDPFGGAGTTGLVAAEEWRKALLVELNPDYAAMARRRVAEAMGLGKGSLLATLPAASLFGELE